MIFFESIDEFLHWYTHGGKSMRQMRVVINNNTYQDVHSAYKILLNAPLAQQAEATDLKSVQSEFESQMEHRRSLW
jgi:hypothetical protein